jgi:O-antigen ligase
LGLLVLLCLLSASWSEAPEFTVRRSVLLASSLLFGFHGYALLREEFITIVAKTILGLVLISVVAYYLLPSIGADPGFASTPMRGVFLQKNILAYNLLIGVVCYLYLWRANQSSASIIAILFFAFCIVLTESATSLAVGIVVICASILLAGIRGGGTKRLLFYTIVVGVILAAGFIAAFPDEAARLLGRDPSLSGRRPIWDVSLVYIGLSPWLGFGYEAFWYPSSLSAVDINNYFGTVIPNAHNGYIDLMLDGGIFGLGLTVVILAKLLVGAIRMLSVDRPSATLILLLLTEVLFHNAAETTFWRSGLMSVLLAYSAARLGDHRASVAGRKLEAAGRA